MNVNRILHHKKAVAAIWILLILFPNPALLPLNVYRFFEMPTRPTNDVQLVADSLPANATAIERYVDSHIHYAYDFQAYGAVWYLPTPSEVLKAQQGDCKSKAVLLASLLEAKQIPHTVKVSPVHFWVDYDGKLRTNFTEQYETTQVAFAENGQFKLPDETNALLYLNVYKDLVWTSMPLLRKMALITGLVLIIQFGHFEGFKKRWRGYMSGLLHLGLVCEIAAQLQATGRNTYISRHKSHSWLRKARGLPSQVKGDRFRAYSRRSSCVQIAPPAYRIARSRSGPAIVFHL